MQLSLFSLDPVSAPAASPVLASGLQCEIVARALGEIWGCMMPFTPGGSSPFDRVGDAFESVLVACESRGENPSWVAFRSLGGSVLVSDFVAVLGRSVRSKSPSVRSAARAALAALR